MKTILNLLRQKTTWTGIVAIATALGATIKPELAVEISAAGMSVAGALLIAFDEKK